jgi:hypothetical protein
MQTTLRITSLEMPEIRIRGHKARLEADQVELVVSGLLLQHLPAIRMDIKRRHPLASTIQVELSVPAAEVALLC